eukprot:CAMPEP_0119012788 /NCGR_PEP_ID=MMETSP1176-20130426/7591_1 /TAXON_ID=265551 /ORGANISM="Synedropsis recta cf, Strain CCMP1620" /LENGTH=234 /DNA_ID=CAMNT_0006965813 /DNA_START=52 /DNA_END=756 /DNA_ORIENTATION=+
MSSSLAIQSNNVGVDLFEIGLLEQAAAKFQVAVEQMSTLLMSDDPDMWALSPDAATQVEYHRPIVGWSKPCSARLAPGSEGIRVYKRAAYLNTTFSPFGIATYTAAPLLNLGLCNHMIAVRDNSSAHLQRASKIYESVMGSLEECRPNDDTNFLLLHLALYTNCGHVLSHQFNNTTGALECFETGCRILTWLHVRNAGLLVLEETEFEELMCNMGAVMEHKTFEIDLGVGAAAA